MEPVLDKLHEDHKNFAKLLIYLEQQLLQLEDCKKCDLSATHDAIRYMKEYADYAHHPLENIVFKYFLNNYSDAHDELIGLLHEHEDMPVLTDKLLEMIEMVLSDMPQERDILCNNLKKYISVQKEHMNREEAEVYPIINATLGKHDWEKMNSELINIDDPIFGDKVENSYKRLFEQIFN